jgi:hypothetical protein
MDGAADMTILDQTGGIVSHFHLPRWFNSRIYPPGFHKKLPLSGLFSCDTPGGPFVAVATVELWRSEQDSTMREAGAWPNQARLRVQMRRPGLSHALRECR